MALEQEIRDAIDSDLPNQIGQRLKTRLERAEADALALKAATEELKSVQAENEMLRERERQMENLEARVEAAAAAEREHLQREAVLTVKEEYADKGRADMFNLLQAVFNGPVSAPLAFKANLYGNYTDQQGMSRNANLSGDAEQSGG
jgi:hypothetical protein